MKELKRKLGWILLFWGIVWYLIFFIYFGIDGNAIIDDLGKSYFSNAIFSICFLIFIPMLVGSILLINEE